ncbi:MAG: hypothetical protein LPJ92_08270 [Rhodobacterales bacterium]|nr:hypothetical protein [Rhodobacterales bacterium]MDX5390329.1 hypothetical protein [Rhodobacterales bacterium]MDX5490017.1 hypothetical protein [Rhodobacterales bacterium]
MSDAFFEFDNRIRRINRKRVNMAGGYVSVVGDDGLIVVKPRRKRARLPIRSFLFLAIGLVGFKAMILAGLGQPVYEDRLEKLRAGSTVERAGAWVMQMDPVTSALADAIRDRLPNF